MKEKTDNIDILEEPKDILYQIDMQLYDEFNDKFCEINENLGTVYSYKDLEDLKKAESDTERTLLRQAISNLIAENKELKEEVERQGVARAIEEDYIEKNFINKNEIKEEIQELKNMKIDGEVFKTAVNYAIKILQSLLGKE